jgi:hypothetical protein
VGLVPALLYLSVLSREFSYARLMKFSKKSVRLRDKKVNSPFQVCKAFVNVKVLPYYLGDVRMGVVRELNKKLMTYEDDLNGMVSFF